MDTKLSTNEQEIQQKHIESTDYITLKAEKTYVSMKQRCFSKSKNVWYADVTICDEWLNDKQSFIQWYREHYYEIEGFSMVLDKDLFGGDAKHYSPETACLLPQIINTMLSNLKRHRFLNRKIGLRLPLGVYYDKCRNKYFSQIKFCGTEKPQKLSYYDTMEEAFEEYRIEKKKDIKRMADKYKEKLPDYIYDALLKVDVKPY